MRWGKNWSKKKEWHLWYAWYPVRLENGVTVWLEEVNRKWSKKKEWHLWYAWYPVRLENGVTVWLEEVNRKIVYEAYIYKELECLKEK